MYAISVKAYDCIKTDFPLIYRCQSRERVWMLSRATENRTLEK